MRRLDGCINCQEVREMAAHGLCFKCYRAAERVQKATPDPVWARLGNGWLLREQKKAFTVVTNILKAISDCPAIEQSDQQQIQNILRPYLDKLAECFAPKEKRKPVNSEQKFERSPVNGRLVRLEEGELSKFVASNKRAGNGLSNQIQSGEEQ
jgi:hypothetical protein